MIIAYKFRLWTTPNQERELSRLLETHRRLYNDALAQRKEAYESRGVTITFEDQSRWLTLERKNHTFLSSVNHKSGTLTLKRLDKAFDNFFRRIKAGEVAGHPRFKPRDRFDSLTFQAGDGFTLKCNRLRIQNVGTIRVCLHRPIEGKIKTVTLKREAEHWYAVFSCDLGPIEVSPSTSPAIGVDVGLESFATTSDGEQFANPRLLKKELPELRRRNRALSRANRGSNRRKKAKRKVSRLHRRVANLRKEHHHQVALSLVRRYGLIAAEKLSIENMRKSRRFARSIADAGWYGFLLTLKFKAAKAGVVVVEVNPAGTSQECSSCGEEVKKSLSVRQHDCPHCGLSIHRDINAAINILARARVQVRTEPAERKRIARSVVPKSPV